MDDRDRRKIKDRYEVKDCVGIITKDKYDDVKKGNKLEIININSKGVLLRGQLKEEQSQKVYLTICKKEQDDIILEKLLCTPLPDCEKRKSKYTNQEHQIVTFENDLTPKDISKLNIHAKVSPHSQPHLWNLMLSDKKEIQEEILHICQCRSDIFIAVITAIFLTVVTIGSLAIENHLKVESLLVASIATFLMFVLGAYTTIEKVRTINLRRGFLANSNDYIVDNLIPLSYRGWAHMKYYFNNCGIMRRLNICPLNIMAKPNIFKRKFDWLINGQQEKNDSDNSNERCPKYGKRKAYQLNKAKTLMPGLADSFMSFTSYVYSFLYIFSLGVISFVLIQYMKDYLLNNKTIIDKSQTAVMFICFFAGVILSLTILMRFRRFLFILSLIVTIILGIEAKIVKFQVENHYYLALAICIGSGFLLGSVGSHLLHSLNLLRKGKQSVESYYYSWQKAIWECCPITDINKEYKGDIFQRLQGLFWGD